MVKISDIAAKIGAKKNGVSEKEVKGEILKEAATTDKEVLKFLIKKEKPKATELIVEEIMKSSKIHTIRDDFKTEIWIYNGGIYVPKGITYIQEYIRKLIDEVYSDKLANEVIKKIAVDTYVNAEDFFVVGDVYKLPVENGILVLKEKRLEEFTDSKYYFQKLPVKYDASKDCPNIKKFFSEVLSTPDDVKVMQELFGYLLIRDQPFEKAFMFSGGGRNGKGKTLLLMKHFLGVENVESIPLQQIETSQFAKAQLLNKLANLCGDISDTALTETGSFKQITGRDLLFADRKHQAPIKFTAYSKLIFSANKLPITHDLSLAFFNRWVLFDFPYIFLTEKEINKLEKTNGNVKLADVEIIEKLITNDELSGLLNWAIDGLHRLLKQKGFSYSPTTEETKNNWLRLSDSFNGFCMDCLEENYDSKITKMELRRAYGVYCRKNKLTPSSDKAIKMILSKTFGVSDERRLEDGIQVYCWGGIRFKNGDEKDDDVRKYS